MTSKIAWLALLSGRLTGIVGAALTVSVITIGIAGWGVISYRYGPNWNVGIVPLVFVLQILLAAWIIRRVLKAEPDSLLYNLLLAFGASFFVLYGWYFLLAGEGGELIAAGNLLYLVAGLMVLCSRLTTRLSVRFGHSPS